VCNWPRNFSHSGENGEEIDIILNFTNIIHAAWLVWMLYCGHMRALLHLPPVWAKLEDELIPLCRKIIPVSGEDSITALAIIDGQFEEFFETHATRMTNMVSKHPFVSMLNSVFVAIPSPSAGENSPAEDEKVVYDAMAVFVDSLDARIDLEPRKHLSFWVPSTSMNGLHDLWVQHSTGTLKQGAFKYAVEHDRERMLGDARSELRIRHLVSLLRTHTMIYPIAGSFQAKERVEQAMAQRLGLPRAPASSFSVHYCPKCLVLRSPVCRPTSAATSSTKMLSICSIDVMAVWGAPENTLFCKKKHCGAKLKEVILDGSIMWAVLSFFYKRKKQRKVF
jgi:hypothetical protein